MMIPEWCTKACFAPSDTNARRARERQATLTKPAGSLGRLEELAIQLAGLQHSDRPCATRAPIIIFAGDHGVTKHGVSAYPSDVTVQMLSNFGNGGAAISVLARELGVDLTVIDAGTLAKERVSGVVTDKPRCGTRDFTAEPALTGAELAFALDCGKRAVVRAMTAGADLLILGEMGIGNTTTASAIACALTGRPPEQIVGDGTGIDPATRDRKTKIVREACARHRLEDGSAPLAAILTCVGGLEIAALSGAILAGAQAGAPVLVDGFIVSVAALAATRINPSCRPWLIISHRSAEIGHSVVLDELGARPILDLELRLGEASGAAVALPVVRLACALHNRMATFQEAAVSGRVQG